MLGRGAWGKNADERCSKKTPSRVTNSLLVFGEKTNDNGREDLRCSSTADFTPMATSGKGPFVRENALITNQNSIDNSSVSFVWSKNALYNVEYDNEFESKKKLHARI